eukprot:scaffold31177_cov80-Cyclotella_meneghiniana.AAC.5
MAGMFSSSLPVSFDKLDDIYNGEVGDFMSRLEFEPVLFGAFDNYQRMIQKKDQTAHKSAIIRRKELPIMQRQIFQFIFPRGLPSNHLLGFDLRS